VSKRILFVALVATAIFAIAVVPAFAEGYNTPTQYTRATGYFSGPHGGYTTTTNKCADCHSTHYAAGSFMLLRANSREAACDYCHGGGGGSTINIMMDNDYKLMSDPTTTTAGIAVIDGGSGNGTGHTLGYTGNAPADIKPAFSSTAGLACFDCHSPHGNSARILTTFANPGREMGTGNLAVAPTDFGYIGNTDGVIDGAGVIGTEWGIDPVQGNLKWWSGSLQVKPIWPNGRFLLVKNPHVEISSVTGLEVADTTVTSVANEIATDGVNKYMIDWEEPLGPADTTYGGYQDNDNDKAYPFAPQVAGEGGFLAESEFCVDCHDGTAGASTQPAEVWAPAGVSGSLVGTYTVAYAHDAQPRH
jgi:hypothetical protein